MSLEALDSTRTWCLRTTSWLVECMARTSASLRSNSINSLSTSMCDHRSNFFTLTSSSDSSIDLATFHCSNACLFRLASSRSLRSLSRSTSAMSSELCVASSCLRRSCIFCSTSSRLMYSSLFACCFSASTFSSFFSNTALELTSLSLLSVRSLSSARLSWALSVVRSAICSSADAILAVTRLSSAGAVALCDILSNASLRMSWMLPRMSLCRLSRYSLNWLLTRSSCMPSSLTSCSNSLCTCSLTVDSMFCRLLAESLSCLFSESILNSSV
mmetsp:Transcript_51046/g.119788  ORF Transcript_51046/g.119788 Transcript_51046/m.119788 type:complete len:272 (+) Transcript_51046:665-1480(+)